MKFLHLSFSLLILLISLNIISASVDLTFAKKEPKELEDLCLRRPYPRQAEPWYWAPMFRAKLKSVGEKYSFPSRCFAKNIVGFKELSKDKIILTLENLNKTDTWCSELFIFHTSNHNFLQFIIFEGYHGIVIKRITQDDKDEIKRRLDKIISTFAGKSYDSILIADLGDSIDQYNKETTRGGHLLPNNMTDKEMSHL